MLKVVWDVLVWAEADEEAFFSALGGGMDRDEAVAVFKETLGAVNSTLGAYYASYVVPLAFYVGATGLVPDSLASKAMTAEQLTDKHPQCKLGKAEKEGTYYEISPGVLLGVFTTAEHFTTDKGLKAIE